MLIIIILISNLVYKKSLNYKYNTKFFLLNFLKLKKYSLVYIINLKIVFYIIILKVYINNNINSVFYCFLILLILLTKLIIIFTY